MPAKAPTGLSTSQQAELLDLYEQGASTYELARRYKIRRDMVTAYVKRSGLPVRPGPQVALETAAQAQVAVLYRSGLSLRKIGDRLGVSDNTVLKALREQGVASRRQRGGIKAGGTASPAEHS